MRQSAVAFKSGELKLEGVVGSPDGGLGPFPGVVICHPGPQGGGNMNNNLVLSVYHALIDSGFIAMRFNFRGVGNSEGTQTQGTEEPADAQAALDTLENWADIDRSRLGMAGYSFGTGVILSGLARYSAAKAFVLFSSPIRFLEYPGVDQEKRPKLFVCGDKDHAVDIDSLKQKVQSLPQPSECRVVPGSNHYWLNYEEQAAQHAVEFFTEILNKEKLRPLGDD